MKESLLASEGVPKSNLYFVFCRRIFEIRENKSKMGLSRKLLTTCDFQELESLKYFSLLLPILSVFLILLMLSFHTDFLDRISIYFS